MGARNLTSRSTAHLNAVPAVLGRPAGSAATPAVVVARYRALGIDEPWLTPPRARHTRRQHVSIRDLLRLVATVARRRRRREVGLRHPQASRWLGPATRRCTRARTSFRRDLSGRDVIRDHRYVASFICVSTTMNGVISIRRCYV